VVQCAEPERTEREVQAMIRLGENPNIAQYYEVVRRLLISRLSFVCVCTIFFQRF
jgi:hypothetical protein